jgi:hypothetical protein
VKKILIAAAAAIIIVVAMVEVASFFHFGDKHVRAGRFDIYTTPKAADQQVSSALYYSRHRLTDSLNEYAVDPNNPDRIIFSSDDIYHRNESVCGTFLYNGEARQLIQLRPWPYAGRSISWSPDSRSILLDRATIRELATGREVDLTAFVSKKNGERVEVTPLQWSPDGKRLAATLFVSTASRDWDEDLVEITVSPLSFRYVASRSGSSLAWSDEQMRWIDGELQVPVAGTSKQNIFVKPLDDLAWTSNPPNSPTPSPLHEHFCAAAESTSR